MNRAYLKLCDKAHLPVDAIGHWPRAEQSAVVMERLRRYKAARGYTLASIATILEAERNNPPATSVPIHAPGLSRAVSQFLKETQ